MTREEMVAERKTLHARLERMRRTGDFAAGASDIRENAELMLTLIDHLLERMR